MNPFCIPLPKIAALLAFAIIALVRPAMAQEAPVDEEGKEGRVQYQLVLPDEKTPERVKPEENNPFESALEAASRNAPEDTEENRVRDVLARLPVVGASVRPDGKIKVMLGDIMLQPGQTVPPVFPDQQVQLTVRNITMQFVELAWQEKEATGLPPKVMLIPTDRQDHTLRQHAAKHDLSAAARHAPHSRPPGTAARCRACGDCPRSPSHRAGRPHQHRILHPHAFRESRRRKLTAC